MDTTIPMMTTMDGQYSIGAPACNFSKQQHDDWLFTCSYVLTWVGICIYFGGLNSEKWL